MVIQEHKHPLYKKELGEREVEINWITFRSNPLDEYFKLDDDRARSGGKTNTDLPNNWGYIFTPWGAYLVEPKYVYRVYDKSSDTYSGRRVAKKDLKFFKYEDIKKNPITDLIIDIKDKRFKNWKAESYKKGNKVEPSNSKRKLLLFLLNR